MNFTFKSAPCGNGILLEEYVGTKKTASRWLSTEEYKSLRQALNNSISITETNAENATPKFKVGDWIVGIDDDGDTSIEMIEDFWGDKVRLVDCDGVFTLYPKSELKQYHLWTIQDAKDGDVLATDNGWTCIFQAFDGCVFSSYCFMDSQKWFCEFGSEAHTPDSRINGNIHPATKEQSDLLFKKMKEAGYQWDADKKELRKIQPHYDITNFKPFDKVLVRDNDRGKWRASIFSYHIKGRQTRYPFCCIGNSFSQCIPFEGNEHLFGTTDMCPEEYINW